ncbi:isochorismate synthase MenF [Streptomyces sp. NPDC127068]|uniref:isochorismate synthase n=1 Tax=Streptomyces sp. NPDC127068 TaxID=3347127 RepID=UPI00365EA0F3
MLVGGFSFRPGGGLPDGLMWVPAVQVAWDGSDGLVLTLNLLVRPAGGWTKLADRRVDHALRLLNAPARTGSAGAPPTSPTIQHARPTREQWRRLVGEALREIDAGTFSKVVLARQVLLRSDGGFSAASALGALLGRQPGGAVFGVGLLHQWFLGSSPECLVRKKGDEVFSHGLAGSAPRGVDALQDKALADFLLSDPKNRREHAVVAEFVERELRRVCTGVEVGTDEPVLKLADVQHLQTKVRGTLHNGHRVDLLTLVDRLHPTPAVAGFPRGPALAWLDRHEPFDRSWYAGTVGWTAADGSGEMTVAIRSTLLTQHTATVYAGCGLVSGSDEKAEYHESSLKMRPMLTALGDVP